MEGNNQEKKWRFGESYVVGPNMMNFGVSVDSLNNAGNKNFVVKVITLEQNVL